MRRRDGDGAGTADVPVKNPFSLLAASKFALLFAGVQLLLKLGQRHLPQSGIYAVAAVAGLTDVDAITASMAERARTTPGEVGLAATAILVACVANTLVKTAMAVGMGRRLGRRVVFGAVAAIGAGALAHFVR
jgi:uncharacterized membrane protein (DUF4010 family)